MRIARKREQGARCPAHTECSRVSPCSRESPIAFVPPQAGRGNPAVADDPPVPAAAAKPVEVRTATPTAAAPVREPEPVPPAVKLATLPTRNGTTSARLSLAAASSSLGLPPLDALPLTANVGAALRDCRLDPRTEGRDVTLDARAVERIAADSEAANALLLRLCGSVRSLCRVGGGGEIAFRR